MDTHKEYYFPVQDDVTSIIGQHNNATTRGTWSGTFKIMTWLYSTNDILGEFSLELHYQDSHGEKVIIIDQCKTTDNSHVLLAGQKLLTISGSVLSAKLKVKIKTKSTARINLLESAFVHNKIKQCKKRDKKTINEEQYLHHT
jgi:hypothetical protein